MAIRRVVRNEQLGQKADRHQLSAQKQQSQGINQRGPLLKVDGL
jgi:hypothetical protein